MNISLYLRLQLCWLFELPWTLAMPDTQPTHYAANAGHLM